MSIVLMKKFISASYAAMKILEERVAVSKQFIRDYHEANNNDDKRLEFEGVVSKFVAIKRYEFDRMGFNEYLMDLGVLPIIANVDFKQLTPMEAEVLSPYKIIDRYARYTPNKAGRVDASFVAEEMSGLDLFQHIRRWKTNKSHYDTLEAEWEKARMAALKSPSLMKNKKLGYSKGSVSLIDKVAEVKPTEVLRYLGSDVLIRTAKVEMSLIDEYVAMGYLLKTDIEHFRKVVDVELRYMVTLVEEENKLFSFFHNRQKRLLQLQECSTVPKDSYRTKLLLL